MLYDSLDLKSYYAILLCKTIGINFLDTLLTWLLVLVCVILLIYLIYTINAFFIKECIKSYLYYLYNGSIQSYYLYNIIRDYFTLFGLLNFKEIFVILVKKIIKYF